GPVHAPAGRERGPAQQPGSAGGGTRRAAREDRDRARPGRGNDQPVAGNGAALMAEPVKIYILDREFVIACPEEERPALLQAAAFLNQKMQEIRDKGKVIGIDRIAVLAALNLAHELQRTRQDAGNLDDIRDRLAALNARLAEATSRAVPPFKSLPGTISLWGNAVAARRSKNRHPLQCSIPGDVFLEPQSVAPGMFDGCWCASPPPSGKPKAPSWFPPEPQGSRARPDRHRRGMPL